MEPITTIAVAAGLAWLMKRPSQAEVDEMFRRLLARSSIDGRDVPDNEATERRLRYVAPKVWRVERLLQKLDPGTRLTSGYRNAAKNAAVGGATASRHLYGLAADFGNHWDLEASKRAARWLRDNGRALGPFRDVLAEVNHLHVEWLDPLGEVDPPGREPRYRQQLTAALPQKHFEALA